MRRKCNISLRHFDHGLSHAEDLAGQHPYDARVLVDLTDRGRRLLSAEDDPHAVGGHPGERGEFATGHTSGVDTAREDGDDRGIERLKCLRCSGHSTTGPTSVHSR